MNAAEKKALARAFRESQSRIGCSGAQLSRWIGFSPEQISRWRCGHWPVPPVVAFAMKALESGMRPD
jgi:hypothetical protein